MNPVHGLPTYRPFNKDTKGGPPCPACRRIGSVVIDSRSQAEATRRRRVCVHCNVRFTTHERVELFGGPQEIRDWIGLENAAD